MPSSAGPGWIYTPPRADQSTRGVRMTVSDYISVIVAMGTLALIIGGWLLKHSSRLTSAEIRIENLTAIAKEDRDRADRQNNSIMDVLRRIEDKVDRKADKEGSH